MDDSKRPVSWEDLIFRPDEAIKALKELEKQRQQKSPMRSGPDDILGLFGTGGPVRARWRDLPPIVRRLCWILPPLGIILASVGIVGDIRGWWGEFGFLTNLFSSTVSLMFALPFALVVVDRLSALNGQVAAVRDVATALRHEVNRLVRATNDVRAMLEAMVVYLDEDSAREGSETLTSELPEVAEAQRIGVEMAEAAERWRSVVPNLNSRIIDVGHRPIDEVSIEAVDEAARQARQAVRAYCKASENSDPSVRSSSKKGIEATREAFSFPTLSFFNQISPLYFGIDQ